MHPPDAAPSGFIRSFIKDCRTLFTGRVVSVEAVSVSMPAGNLADYEVIRHPGAAAIVALDDKDRVCLLRQFRPAAGGWICELPAGRREPAEPPQQTAVRELAEEAGRSAAVWRSLGSILSSPGVCDEEVHLFLATGLAVKPVHHEPFEAIEIHWVAFSEALDQALTGEIRDSKTLAGLVRANAIRHEGGDP
jgi:ADP-ribose pyrophosphatase